MEATKAAPPKSSAAVNDSSGTNNAASAEEATTATNNNNNNDTSSSNKSESEDFLMFGARPSHLFDDIAITIDSLLTEEIASLPLLPRTLTDEELRQASSSSSGDKPLTGEQKLIAKLRKAYKKNLDLAETYCSRNVFTVQYYSKTKRRKILENFLHSEENNNGEDEEGQKINSSEQTAHQQQQHTTLPSNSAIFAAPIEGEIPTREQISDKDKEILIARQRIQHEKQRRIELKRQLERLNRASQTLLGVHEALKKGIDASSDGSGAGEEEGTVSSVSMDKLKETISTAMEGHEELKVWNARAEEVIQILDKIKVEREMGNNGKGKSSSSSAPAGGNKRAGVTGREDDERERKRMLEEVGGTEGSTRLGTKEQVESLLKKLRGSKK